MLRMRLGKAAMKSGESRRMSRRDRRGRHCGCASRRHVGVVMAWGWPLEIMTAVGKPIFLRRRCRGRWRCWRDDGDFYAGEAALADGSGDGEEVGAAAGEEDAEANV